MNRFLLISNIILLVAVAVLFFLHFKSPKKAEVKSSSVTESSKKETEPGNFSMAYFEMDSLDNSFAMMRDVRAELNRKEEDMNRQLTRMQQEYQNKVNEYQSRAQTMTQVQSELATKDLLQRENDLRNRKQLMDQDYQDFYMRKRNDVKTVIEEFLKEYNRNKSYSYIIAYEPGFVYYKDTMFNITSDVIRGLNETYKSKKK